ncbi:hypothetical protein AZH53_07610 [Methanomicrobiaceae archaeon CYW5]|uniref:nucleotidyltransferase domain-containing protein n=1 Tax=Methanovulcanius yangii TaxID=1789227 RepID=UPI0029C9DB85|nr:nucleotidyltransferase domain-containing protein [Methanovulcanius yangii]MBT8508269.1 hypothetical protein [Methanovulcanius yangii]
MISEFSIFVGNRVLAWLLSHPSSAPGINELGREVGVSPASAKQYVDILLRDGIVRKQKAGTAHLISLNNEYVLVREMKRTLLVARLLEAGVAEGIGEHDETDTMTETGMIDVSGVSECPHQYPSSRGIAPGCTSLALYGSGARGTYDEQSDIDLLVIGEESCVRYDAVQAIEEELGFELQVTAIPYYRWEPMKESGDAFARSVMRDHILLAGVSL